MRIRFGDKYYSVKFRCRRRQFCNKPETGHKEVAPEALSFEIGRLHFQIEERGRLNGSFITLKKQ